MSANIPRYFGCVGAVIVLLIAMIIIFLPKWELEPPQTSSEASREEIAFLELPEDAQAIRYWNEAMRRIVVFETSEENFRTLFSEYEFEEISEPLTYPVAGFGDPEKFPKSAQNQQQAEAGLVYRRTQKNGGGLFILYDRARSTAFYRRVLR